MCKLTFAFLLFRSSFILYVDLCCEGNANVYNLHLKCDFNIIVVVCDGCHFGFVVY